MTAVSSQPSRLCAWSDYVEKYEEASDFLNEAQGLAAQLNIDLQDLNTGSYQKIELDVSLIRGLGSELSKYPGLDQGALNQFMTGLDASVSQVLSNYIPMTNGSKAAKDMNTDPDTEVTAYLVDKSFKDLELSDLKKIKGLPSSKDFQNKLFNAICNSIIVTGGVYGIPVYNTHDQKFEYISGGITYSVKIDPTSAGPDGSHTKVEISANATLGALADQGLVSVQLKPGGTAGIGALTNFLNSF